jgi:YidC/Oxa1 family membrane protein insertase
MDKRFLLFIVIAFAALAANSLIVNWLFPPPPVAEQPQDAAAGDGPPAADGAQPAVVQERPAKPDDKPKPKPAPQPERPATKQPKRQWLTLGSADRDSPYRMLVVVSNVGAAVDQIDLNHGFYDLDENDRSGDLGPLALTDAPKDGGAIVHVVGPGTPAAIAGLQPQDVITSFDGQAVTDADSFRNALLKTRPNRSVRLTVKRQDKAIQPITATLANRPLRVVSRERNALGGIDPASLLLTLAQLGDAKLDADQIELKGLSLRTGRWQVRHADQETVEFAWPLADHGVELVKRFRLARDPAPVGNAAPAAPPPAGPPLPGYHLELDIELHNTGEDPLKIAYQLDGPTGLPTEGWWYASKISRQWWHSVGVRDLAVRFHGNEPQLIGCVDIANGNHDRTVRPDPLDYIGIDAQYFSAVLQPQTAQPEVSWLADAQAIVVGPVPEDKARRKLTNTSCRLTSKPVTLEPGGPPLSHTYRMFAGPKNPDILSPYNLDPLVYFGWPIFAAVSRFLLRVLHFFHTIVGNYGLAIVMLTVLVRGCMFPISRKQALGAQKMQELQPELKKLNEKYKSQPEQRTKATQDLFRKHNYNPFSGCLLVFLQLPIFMGLYRGLMISVELRQAPLLSWMEWCSNLAAPDMLFRWSGFLPGFIADETGWLGPFFNLLPVFTVGLFLWQQKMFMPPPADEQAALQQKMMQYMMIFMAVMFFKVASGLCLYFIASSLWSIAERKLLPKASKPAEPGAETDGSTASPRSGQTGSGPANGNGAPEKRKKKQPRGRR